MSGQLVGEVLDAAEAGHLDKLSRPAFAALIAVAERCHHLTRQGTVRQVRIQAAIHASNSTRTTSRAIRELKDAGFVRIVKRGYRLPTGQANSPIYELSTLPPSKVAETSSATHPPSKVAATTGHAYAKTRHAYAKTAHASATQGGDLDGSNDGSIDGEGLRQSGTSPDEPHPSNNPPPPNPNAQQPPDPEPSRFCPRHAGGTDKDCRACGRARLNHEAWKTRDNERAAERRGAIRQAIDACDDCDDYGRPLTGRLANCPNHPNFWQLAKQATRSAGANTAHAAAGVNRLGPYIAAIAETKTLPG